MFEELVISSQCKARQKDTISVWHNYVVFRHTINYLCLWAQLLTIWCLFFTSISELRSPQLITAVTLHYPSTKPNWQSSGI